MEIPIPDCLAETVLPNEKFHACAKELVGADEILRRLQTHMELSFAPSKLFLWMQKYCKGEPRCPKYRGSVLLVGPSGTGKTTVAMASADNYARSSGTTVYFEELGLVREKFVGSSSKNIKSAFNYIKFRAEKYKVVFLINEFDSVGVARSIEQQHDDTRAMVNTLIQEMDKLDNHNIFNFATSNFEGKIDHAVKRRFDFILSFQRPSVDERIELLQHLIRGWNISAREISILAKKSDRFTHDDITRWVDSAIEDAFSEDKPLSFEHLKRVLKEMKPTGDYDGQ